MVTKINYEKLSKQLWKLYEDYKFESDYPKFLISNHNYFIRTERPRITGDTKWIHRFYHIQVCQRKPVGTICVAYYEVYPDQSIDDFYGQAGNLITKYINLVLAICSKYNIMPGTKDFGVVREK